MRTIRQVSADEIEEYYIKLEMSRAVGFHKLPTDVQTCVDKELTSFIKNLDLEQRAQVMMGLSRKFVRINIPLFIYSFLASGIIALLRSRLVTYKLMSVHPSELYLGPVNDSKTNKILASPNIDWRLDRFATWLMEYFSVNSKSNNSFLEQFRLRSKDIFYTRSIGLLKRDRIVIIDGTHRSIWLAMKGVDSFEVYVGSSRIVSNILPIDFQYILCSS